MGEPSVITDPLGRPLGLRPHAFIEYRRWPSHFKIDAEITHAELRALMIGLWWTLGPDERASFVRELEKIRHEGVSAMPEVARYIVQKFRDDFVERDLVARAQEGT